MTNESELKFESFSKNDGIEFETGDKGLKNPIDSSKMSLPVQVNLSSPAVREWLAKRREEIRPWATFVKTSNFETPSSLPKLSNRLQKNVEYFQSNYVFVFLVLFVYCLVTSPLLLLVLAFSGGASYFISNKNGERKLFLGGREVTLAQQYMVVGICSIPLLLIAGAGAAVFWVIGASIFVIGIHASFFNYDAIQEEVHDDKQQLTGNIIEDV